MTGWIGLVALAAAVTLGACGGDDDATTSGGGAGGGGASGPCLDNTEASDLLESATYAVVMQFLRGFEVDGSPVYANEFVGTAFAVSDLRLVTNAHVAEVPFQVPGVQVVAVQAGTGTVVNLLTAYMHPDYDGADSPDIGVFTTQETLPASLPLAPNDVIDLSNRQDILLTGFPGDVESIFPVDPGEAVPQASASSGRITALRNFADDVEVEPANVDVIQHDATTTGGNSGSAIFSCNEVIGIHNAGVAFEVFTQEAGGQVGLTRVDGTNRFGIHVRYIHELLDLIDSGSLSGQTVQGTGELDNCPDPNTYLDRVAAATYVVVLEVLAGRDAQGQPIIGHQSFGTAFAVAPRLLVTNAHVTEGTKQSQQPVLRVLGVQSGTGNVITLLRGITHPGYTEDPLVSPDVGLFTSDQQLPVLLDIANPAAINLQRGDPISVTGFPGDVDTFISVVPGQTVPQATSLSGTVTALRSHDQAAQVDASNTDVIQHQAPTTPGTSGSALIHCGRVVGTNNAGTVQLGFFIDMQTGETRVDRTAAAANNFAVHGKHIVELIDLFNSQALQGFELPPPPAQPTAGGGPGQQQSDAGWFVGTWAGGSPTTNPGHNFVINVGADGSVTGTSSWPTGEFMLVGQVDQNGYIYFTDDAAERLGFRTGVYEGYLYPSDVAEGIYYESGQEDVRYLWSAQRSG